MNRGALEELKGTPMVSDQSAPESIACAQPSEWFPESEKTAARDPYTPSPHTNTPANKGRRWLRGILGAVVGVSAVLLVLYLMTAKELGREEARRINCALNLKQMGLALRMYSSDYGESFPPDWAHLMALDYLTTGRVYTCPSQSTLPPQNAEQLTTGDRCDYLYFGAGLTEECDGHPPAKTILACDKPGNHNGRLVSDGHLNVLFADGSVRGYTGVNSIGQLAERQGLYLLSRP
jgi:prepilin-type processing-associated H-X9-DG protein